MTQRERYAQHRPRTGSPTAPRDSISQRAPRPRRRRRAGKMAALVSPLATARCLLRALGCRGRLLPPHRGQCRRRGSPGLARPGRAAGCWGTAQEGHRGAVAGAGACLPSPSCRGSVPGGGEVGGGAGRAARQPPGHARASPLCHDLPVSSHSRPGLVRDIAPEGTCLPGWHRESAPGDPRRGPVASRAGDAAFPLANRASVRCPVKALRLHRGWARALWLPALRPGLGVRRGLFSLKDSPG